MTMSYFRVTDKCNGCLSCVENCPASALNYNDCGNQRTLQHNMTKCARCGQCWRVCPQEAIEFQHLLTGQWDDVVTLDLVRCQVCGEPIYTTPYQQKYISDADLSSLALCPRHRQRQAASKRPLSISVKTPSKLENK